MANLLVEPLRGLNLGCGHKHRDNCVNLDLTSDSCPDVVHDLNIRPWPFPDNRFDSVIAMDVIEHLDDIVRTMEEIHRICTPGAVVEIVVPHFSSGNAFTDPTHRHYFSQAAFEYFTDNGRFPFYTRCRFRQLRSEIVFYPGPFKWLVRRWANRWPALYERRWAWTFPAWFLGVDLQVLKSE